MTAWCSSFFDLVAVGDPGSCWVFGDEGSSPPLSYLRRWLYTDPSCPQCRYTLPPSGASMPDLMQRPREALDRLELPQRSTSSYF